MYSRAEVSQARQAFWTAFGQYMAPQLSAEGGRINWINYKTGEKDIYFRMHAGKENVRIGIELAHKDAGVQQLYFEQFEQLKTILHRHVGEAWIWQPAVPDENSGSISRIFKEQNDTNILLRENWPQAISFFKPRIMALDAFWTEVKFAFEAFR